MSYRLVELDKSRLKEYVKFKNQCHEESKFVNPTDAEKALEMITEYKEDEDKMAYVFVNGSEIIGQMLLKFKEKESICHITLITVLEAYYGKGIAKQLIEKAISDTKKKDLNAIELTVNRRNKRGIAFYEKMGFKYLKDQFKHNLIYRMEFHSIAAEAHKANPAALFAKW